MAESEAETVPQNPQVRSKRAELVTFLVLAFGVWPFIAIGVVAGYGLLVWIVQMIYGPPGPPASIH